MSVFTSFFELLIKQTCRRASYEFEMDSKQSKSTEDSYGIYSLRFLKSLYDKPRDNIHKLLQIPENSVKNLKLNGLNWLNGSEVTNVQRMLLLDFLKKVKDMSPSKSQQWIDLQHYMHYVYRNFSSSNPDPSAEVLSTFFLNEVKDLVKSLIKEDESQLYLRILALLREYCIFAQWNYSKSDGEHMITKLFYYYEAMLSAAKNLSAVFSDFEGIIYKNYSVCWIDFNTCVFIRYFFETEYVQKKIHQCLETRVSPGDTPAMFGLLEDLKNLWVKEQKRLDKINEDAALNENNTEEFIMSEHKKVLSNNFWMERSSKELSKLNMSRFDHQIFCLLGDPTFHPAGPILDRNGQCICEECLIAKYKYILDLNKEQINEKLLKNSQRLSYCRRCQNLVDLNYFHHHINCHIDPNLDHSNKSLNQSTNLSRIISGKIDFVKLGNGSNLTQSPLTEQPADKELHNSDINKDPLPKLGSEAPVLKNTCDVHLSKTHTEQKNDVDSTKAVFKEFLKQKTEGINKSDNSNKNISLIKIKNDIFSNSNGNNAGDEVLDVFKQTSQHLNASKKCEPSLDVNLKIRDMKKNGHKPYPLSCKSTGTTKSCEHNCKHEEETKLSTCQSHGSNCDHYKESKKCDCPYCEVFASSVTSHTHKSNELRDRLRIRLHQRREKRTKDTYKTPSTSLNVSANVNSVKLKNAVNKVEERVPLPSSPTNIPPAPSVKSSDSSITTSSATDDIHGLVNYIEGNTALNKLELAQKKAAKKARQRLKKEEERIKIIEEQRRLAAELIKQENEKRNAINKTLTKNSYQGKNDSRKRDKKQVEKTKTHNKTINDKSQVLEETIPAMVTIKRVAENGSCSPTVTITLKGSTPDQDKLLYTLVNGTDENTSVLDVNNSTSKKKKKKQQQLPNQSTVISKELKVTLALDSNKSNTTNVVNQETKKKRKNGVKGSDAKKAVDSKQSSIAQDDIPIPMLRLPPGITITKVEGPVTNRCYQATNIEDQKGTTINMGKSGVIVVDTEKLIQNKQFNESTQAKSTKTGKKNRKKKNKKLEMSVNSCAQPGGDGSKKMITLKNPIFQSFQSKPEHPVVDKNGDNCGPAAIFTNENGMVTIRSSRLQQSLTNGGVMNSMPIMAMPKLLPETQKCKVNSNCAQNQTNLVEEKNEVMSPFNAQEILSGLPGIEITKVDKSSVRNDLELNKTCQAAQVSIIPASNSGEKFSFDKDDWLYDSVFTPRDVLEDDMDAEELELEAFKRFCQQSIPPPRKEKVAHLNVADIVLKKKTDVNLV